MQQLICAFLVWARDVKLPRNFPMGYLHGTGPDSASLSWGDFFCSRPRRQHSLSIPPFASSWAYLYRSRSCGTSLSREKRAYGAGRRILQPWPNLRACLSCCCGCQWLPRPWRSLVIRRVTGSDSKTGSNLGCGPLLMVFQAMGSFGFSSACDYPADRVDVNQATVCPCVV